MASFFQPKCRTFLNVLGLVDFVNLSNMLITLIGLILLFILLFAYSIPKEVEKKRKQDQAYANRKGITLQELQLRRSKQRARTINKSTREYVMSRDNYQCVYCGATDNLAIDHYFPFSRGGGN